MKKLISTLFILLLTANLFAQGAGSAVVDTLSGSDKIYVVVTCVALILVGLLLFLFSMERRIKKLEKKS